MEDHYLFRKHSERRGLTRHTGSKATDQLRELADDSREDVQFPYVRSPALVWDRVRRRGLCGVPVEVSVSQHDLITSPAEIGERVR